jgi:hypothetical protein
MPTLTRSARDKIDRAVEDSIEAFCAQQRQRQALCVRKFMLRTKPRNKCCPITLNPLGKFSPYFLLFEGEQLYIFEAAPLAHSCMENGAFSPITRRKLNVVELRRLARAASLTLEEIQTINPSADEQADLLSFLSEDVGGLLNEMSAALSSEADTLEFWESNQSRILQAIANLCQVNVSAVREVIETHIRRVELLCCRNAAWVAHGAARFFLSELYNLRALTVADAPRRSQQRENEAMIRLALHNIRLNAVRTRQTQVDNQLSEYMNTGVPDAVRSRVRDNATQEEQVNSTPSQRFTTLNDVLLTHTLLNMVQENSEPRRIRISRRVLDVYAVRDSEEPEFQITDSDTRNLEPAFNEAMPNLEQVSDTEADTEADTEDNVD